MHVILTHEQADFDAIASQLGTYLLDEKAIPVLPARINRNVRAFLTIYGAELTFIERSDLPKNPINRITLVDTQSMISLKGMHKETQVSVIDHHELREDLPLEWNASVQSTGATATLLVEVLHERGMTLNPVQATLILLGIYEDTGSLTYTRTTSRDLQAAAYLLDQGASLNVASTYLNHPLSLSQQDLYDQLRKTAETIEVHGHNILITKGDAIEMDEELSTIAHKLRDLLDPEGLFMLMRIRGGVQLIARSTNDQINVSEVASHFGGGGHPRAAAAMIKVADLEGIYQELVEILPKYVRPAISVSSIMSRGAQMLNPSTSLKKAQEMMQKYGYEGFPVVDRGQVVGLLTRRAVDRAIGHGLNLTVSNVMDAGATTITPEMSIEHLQRLMADTGWGQIPVVNSTTRKIIGIVTRTDLLKTLTPTPVIPGVRNLATRLEKALPPIHLALLKTIASAAGEQNKALYIVGGFVRDLILERPSLDFDLVVEGEAIPLAKHLAKTYGGRTTTHARFGTAKWIIKDIREDLEKWLNPTGLSLKDREHDGPTLPETVDLITARTEFYNEPTALPIVEHGSIKLDLHRRDFTINTLALRLDGSHYGELHDYWGGLVDITRGIIRVLHSISFVDDPTRMLRAVRFEQRFGFMISDRTLELIKAALVPSSGSGQPLLDKISGDRIRHEIDHILDEPKTSEMINRLEELGLLKAIHPAIPWDDWIADQIRNLPETFPSDRWDFDDEIKGIPVKRALCYILWFITCSTGQAQEITKRLKIPAALRRTILSAQELWSKHKQLSGSSPSEVVKVLEPFSDLAIYAVRLGIADREIQQQVDHYIYQWQHIKPHTTGSDLRKSGISPSPIYKDILDQLRAAWLENEIHSVDEEKALLETLIAEHTSKRQKE